MHEVSIASNIFKIVLDELKSQESFPVLKKVRLKVGQLTAVVPEALDFAWTAITKGTELEGSELEIEEIPILLKCHSCGVEFNIDNPIFICESCGSKNTELLTGDELDLISLIVD